MNGFLMALVITASLLLPWIGLAFARAGFTGKGLLSNVVSLQKRRMALALGTVFILLAGACTGVPYYYGAPLAADSAYWLLGLFFLGIGHLGSFACAGILTVMMISAVLAEQADKEEKLLRRVG